MPEWMRRAARARTRPQARRRPDQPQLRSRHVHGESSQWPSPSRTSSSRRSDRPQERAPAPEKTLAFLSSLAFRRSPDSCRWLWPRTLPSGPTRPPYLEHGKHPPNRHPTQEERLKRAARTRHLDLAVTSPDPPDRENSSSFPGFSLPKERKT